jgi:conjugative transfer signal peptidase TraF
MRKRLLAALAVALLALVASIEQSLVHRRFILNLTNSLPLGLYLRRAHSSYPRGALIAFPVPAQVASLVNERHYLPPHGVLLKRVAAIAGDEACLREGSLTVNGRELGASLREDLTGRPLPQASFCGVLQNGTLLVVGDSARSFDSRHFGLVDEQTVLGAVQLIWGF